MSSHLPEEHLHCFLWIISPGDEFSLICLKMLLFHLQSWRVFLLGVVSTLWWYCIKFCTSLFCWDFIYHSNYYFFEGKLFVFSSKIFFVFEFMICLGTVFIFTSPLGVCGDYCVCDLISLISFGKFSTIISLNIFSASFLCPLCMGLQLHICWTFSPLSLHSLLWHKLPTRSWPRNQKLNKISNFKTKKQAKSHIFQSRN